VSYSLSSSSPPISSSLPLLPAAPPPAPTPHHPSRPRTTLRRAGHRRSRPDLPSLSFSPAQDDGRMQTSWDGARARGWDGGPTEAARSLHGGMARARPDHLPVRVGPLRVSGQKNVGPCPTHNMVGSGRVRVGSSWLAILCVIFKLDRFFF